MQTALAAAVVNKHQDLNESNNKKKHRNTQSLPQNNNKAPTEEEFPEYSNL